MLAALDRPVGRREIGMAAALGLVGVAVAVALLRGAGGGGAPGAQPAELAAPAPAPPAPAVAPAASPEPPLPLPPEAPGTADAAPDPRAVEAAAPAGLKLRGVLGGAAIIERPDGRQLLARMGRMIAPGVTLVGVGQDHVLLEAGGARLRLGFGDGGPTASAAAVDAPAPARATAPAARAGPVVAGLADAARAAGRAYKLGLRPVDDNGRTTGFRVMPGVRMPGLDEAGLRPGDIITSVNGMAFEDEERVAELGDEIAGSYEATFEWLRDGQPMTRTVAVNPRPAVAAR